MWRRIFDKRSAEPSAKDDTRLRAEAPDARELGPALLPEGLPALCEVEGTHVPEVPGDYEQAGVESDVLSDLILKLAYTTPSMTTQRAIRELCLPLTLVSELLKEMNRDKLVESVGQEGPLNYRWSITDNGRERARWLMESCAYVGPAPVSLDDYYQMIEWQCGQLFNVSPDRVREALKDLILPDDAIEVVALAASSGRSLFLYGPPGNGKTSVGRLLHKALTGTLWIPYCVSIANQIIQVFDPRFHQTVDTELDAEQASRIDRRWIRIRQPLVVVGGDLTLADLELAHDAALGIHTLPVHLKANGGVFLLDDFGCQSVEADRLLNRWIVPLEYKVDHLTLRTGQKVQVPFLQMLVMSTNLDPERVMTPALLRRMGYRLRMDRPSAQRYTEIFQNYAARCDVEVSAEIVDALILRHHTEDRPLSGCTPRDLFERCRDICRSRGQALEINQANLDLAWKSYFGTSG